MHDDMRIPDVDGAALAGEPRHPAIHPVAVDNSAVGAFEILDLAAAAVAHNLGMMCRDGAAVDDEVVVRRAADPKRALGEYLRLLRPIARYLYPAVLHNSPPNLPPAAQRDQDAAVRSPRISRI